MPAIFLLVALAAPAEGTPASALDAKRVADRILQQPIYHRWELRQKRASLPAPVGEAHWQQNSKGVLDWLLDRTQWIGGIWQSIVDWWNGSSVRPERNDSSTAGSGFGSVLNWAGWIFLAVLVCAILFMIHRLWITTKWEGSPARVMSRRQVRDALQNGEALAMSSSDWLAEGEKWGRDQEHRLVYRALYLGLLSGLHSQGRIDFRRNRTNWVYVSRFRGTDDHRNEFATLTALFDDVWYGGIDAAEQRIEPLKEQVKRLLEAGPTHA